MKFLFFAFFVFCSVCMLLANNTARLGDLRSDDRVVTNAIDHASATNISLATRNMIYDDTRGVTWVRTMVDGNIYYHAVTNINLLEVAR